MKKSIYLLLLVPFLMLGCKQNDEPGGGDKSLVLGKSFKNYSISQFTHSTEESTEVVAFPHERVCNIRTSVTTYWDDGDVESGSFNSYYEYNVKGNEVILIDLDTEEEAYRFKYQNGNLVLGSDVYVDNGTVEMDPSLDNRIPPEGKRSYIDVGWYDSGLLEQHVDYLASDMYNMGDYEGLQRLPQEIYEWSTLPSSIHVRDANTIATIIPGISLNYHDSYATQTYGNYTYYFYFEYYYYIYSYRVIDDTVYLQDMNGEWGAAGTYDAATETLHVSTSNLLSLDGNFRKVVYNGYMDYPDQY